MTTPNIDAMLDGQVVGPLARTAIAAIVGAHPTSIDRDTLTTRTDLPHPDA